MLVSAAQQSLIIAREALAHPMDFAAFLANLSLKDRASAQRRIDVLEKEVDPALAHLWRRLACALMTLAPFAAKLIGKQTMQIYIADGRYRLQVFALEDLQNQKFTIYCPDILNQAIESGLLAPGSDSTTYTVTASGEPLQIDALTGKTPSPGAHFKDMTGWNRKALRITLPPSPSPAQIEAAELLCAMAAQHFVHNPPPPAMQKRYS